MSATYPYATGDLLSERNTYFYSAYEGPGFLGAWEDARVRVLERLAAPGDMPVPRGGALPDADGVEARALLERLLAGASGDEGAWAEVRPWLDRLVQRFEVTKRIFESYDVSLRARDRERFRDLGLYLRFAEVLEVAYERTAALPYLNALLKCADTLTAMHARLSGDEGARLARLILRERQHVRRLAEHAGVRA